MLTPRERGTLRDLARRVAEIGSAPLQEHNRQLWKRQNSLQAQRPLVLCFPEGAWRECLPDESLTVQDDFGRRWEWHLRHLIYRWEHLRDDNVIEPVLKVSLAWDTTGWGLQPEYIRSTEERGAWHYDPPIKAPEDADRLHLPELIVDEAATRRRLEMTQDLFGDILEVQPRKIAGFGWGQLHFGLVSQFASLRGLDQIMVDICDRPEWVHRVMELLTTGRERLLLQMEEQGLLDLNNRDDYVGSGGVGYTDELPAPGYAGKARRCDQWAFAEAQEFALVSPAMHEEFVLQYQRRLCAPFGLVCYGCCEDFTHKLDLVFTVPHLRRISISPWTDVRVAAERLGNRYVFSWKPAPSMLAQGWDEEAIRKYIRGTVQVARKHGCVLEMIMKDTHTVCNEPWRLSEWVRIAKEEALR